MGTRRVVVVEEAPSPGGGPTLRATATRTLEAGERLVAGREADLPVGAEPEDRRVSRVALAISCAPAGWEVVAQNRNGVVVHPWALPAWRARAGEVLADARVALRVLGAGELRHWVLLEDDARLQAALPGAGPDSLWTEVDTPARPLTPPQTEVLAVLFADLFAWPPVVGAEPRQLKQVARAVGVSLSGVQARLAEVRGKAARLGLAREVPLTDPEYVYVLVRAGYLSPARDLVPRY